MSYYVAVHGGAGCHSATDDKVIRKALRRACVKALEVLQSGKKASSAVERSILELEDSEYLNAGYGANLTDKGTVECDAGIMDSSGNFGSVGAVSGVKNPICVAKAILDRSCVHDPLGRVAPLTLVSEGARDFASASGIPTVHPHTLISPRAQNEWKVWNQRANLAKNDTGPELQNAGPIMQDTVGAVTLDASGDLAAGVSSGGLLLKRPGRIGEAAVFGAGCWAQNTEAHTGVACSISGTGESITRASLARTVGETLCRFPEDPHEELRRVITNDFAYSRQKIGGQNPSAGVITLTKERHEDGSVVIRLWCAFNTPSMAIGYASSEDSKPKSMILRRTVSDPSDGIYLTVLPWTND